MRKIQTEQINQAEALLATFQTVFEFQLTKPDSIENECECVSSILEEEAYLNLSMVETIVT